MKRKRIILASILLLTFIFANTSLASGNEGVSVFVDQDGRQREILFNEDLGYPLVDNGRVYIPLRIISEELGHNVKWDASNMAITITDNTGNNILLKIGESHAMVNGTKTPIDIRDGKVVDTKAFVKKERTYVPIRFISEVFKAEVKYEQKSNPRHHIVTIVVGKGEEVVSGKWIEPKFDVDMSTSKDQSYMVDVGLLNTHEYTKSNSNAKFEVKLRNPEKWEKYLIGFSKDIFKNNSIYPIDRTGIVFNEYIPNGTARTELFYISIHPNLDMYENKQPMQKPAIGTELVLDIKLTIDGVTKPYEVKAIYK